jgi:hypothetical protein
MKYVTFAPLGMIVEEDHSRQLHGAQGTFDHGTHSIGVMETNRTILYKEQWDLLIKGRIIADIHVILYIMKYRKYVVDQAKDVPKLPFHMEHWEYDKQRHGSRQTSL